MASKDKIQQQFNEIRKKYPQKLIQLSQKQSLLQQCIQKCYFSQFEAIYIKQAKSNQTNLKSNNKVLDQTDDLIKGTKQSVNKNILQAIKIIVKAYQKNTSINQVYSFQNVQQMIQKTKITLKQLIKTQKDGQKPKVQQNKQDLNKINTQKAQQSKVKNEQIPIANQKIQQAPAPVKPKSNSLFVQKQAPISQKNIFKKQNDESRPSSRLLNQKIQHNIIPEKPRSKSSAKSNRSKRSHISSRGPSQNIPISEDVDKKSQRLSQSGLRQQIPVQKTQIKIQRKMTLDKNKNQIKMTDSHQNQPNQSNEQEIEDEKKPQQQNSPIEPKSEIKKIKFNSNDESLHLPAFKLSTERPILKKNPIDSILTNPFIKKTFSHLCKQSYIGGGKTFDQISQSADIMTLNKWMVFCKEFDFLSKLKKKVLVDIFQQTTLNKPQMSQQQFLDALIIVQSKLRVDEQDFIRKSMCLDSEFAFRQKVATFKINYTGPKQNFFEEATFKPLDKYYQNLREVKYQQERKKQREVILFQGKFKQQIENELLDRKNYRQMKKSHLINSMMFEKVAKNLNPKVSLSTSIDAKKNQNESIKSPYLNYLQKKTNIKVNQSNSSLYDDQIENSKLKISRRIDPITYTEIFSQKHSNNTRAITTGKNDSSVVKEESKTKRKNDQSRFIQSPLRAATQLSKIKPKNNAELIHKTTQRKTQKAQEIRPKRQWTQQIKNWGQQFDKSQSEESDEILKEHLKKENIKKTPMPQKMELSQIMEKYKNDQKWLQHNDHQDQHSEWDRETQFQTTIKKQRFK